MAKTRLRLEARTLRQNGLGIKTIAYQLKVSSSTVSLWCRDIQLTDIQIEELERRSHDPYYGRRLGYVKKQQAKRQETIKKLFSEGIADVGRLSPKELFIAGISLYWAEGFKKDNQFGFSNSDPKKIKFMIFWLKKCCRIKIYRLKVRLGLNIQYQEQFKQIEQYWSDCLDIPLSQFQKPFFQKVIWQKQYDHPENYHGVLRIRVSKSSDLLRKMYGWIGGINKCYK